MKLVLLNKVPIFEQLQLEEALLRAGSGNWCLLNRGSPPAIVMGISGVPHELVETCDLPLIRRFSGGGCVVVDESTFFVTFIGDMPHPTPCKIHRHVEERLQPIFAHLPFQLRENDYVLGDKKFGGNAQYIAKNRYLHHSSLLWRYNPDLMALLKMPTKTPLYRQGRGHFDFLTTLESHFLSLEHLLESFIARLGAHQLASPQELAEIQSLPHRQALEWIAKLS